MADDFRSVSPSFADLADISLDGSFDSAICFGTHSDAPPSEVLHHRFVPSFPHFETNAVHMEIQNNAMLPTFNLNVDRSNSSNVPRITSQQPYSPTTRKEIEEMVRLSENDFSLAEVFLKSSDRSSQNMNYNAAGALLAVKASSTSVTTTPSSFSTGDTTLAMNPSDEQILPLQSLARSQYSSSHSTEVNPGGQSHYRRPHALPIPGQVDTQESKDNRTEMDNAVAIAAAIASQDPAATAAYAQPLNTEQLQKRDEPVQRSIVPKSIALNAHPPPTLSEQGIRFHFARPMNTLSPSQKPYSRLTAQVAAPSPQILAATMLRSQFGFGGDHKVPSVPNPPQRATVKHTTLSSTGTTPTTATVAKTTAGNGSGNGKYPRGKSSSTRSDSQSPSPPPSIATRAGPAYERKKQRAKDARTRLKDSIEALSIAMNFSGAQSLERAQEIHQLDAETRNVMEECAQIAETAKKWERPEFVGTAANLILKLNSQCEALFRELQKFKATTTSSLTSPKNGFHCRDSSQHGNDQHDSNAKRRKVESIADFQRSMNEVFSTPSILRVLASYLCPQSLLRCQTMSKCIRHSFSQDTVWLDCCIQRFGAFQVRQWKEKLDDSDELDFFVGTRPAPLSLCQLYRQMDAQNVKPYVRSHSPIHPHHGHHHHPLQSIMTSTMILAETRIPHKVSAWVSMVERSNGETTRCVRQASGRYASVQVLELHIWIQNTGSITPVIIKEQVIAVDASTRRRGEVWYEVSEDTRFAKRLFDSQGDPVTPSMSQQDELVRLRLFESVVLVVHILCKGCSTSSKFRQRANFAKMLIQLNGITVPMAIPFVRNVL